MTEAKAEILRLARKLASASAVVQFYANSSKDAFAADAGHLARTEFSRIFEG
jgi:hypothetical protein